ncbi:MAG: hypothetical protein DHS20C15_26360 [Planctomycetota bacterium]|nr:MAG: hypothetical protein DHS20C15_26360 [Planctomycetota bacterium]
MRARLLLPLVFLALLLLAWSQNPTPSGQLPALRDKIIELNSVAPKEGGSWPDEWIAGKDCDNDPAFQVHAYNANTFFIRQSKCDIYEAPFLYLLFGEDEALLMDTGALDTAPLRATIDGVIEQWLLDNGRTSIPLTVAHTHGHFDHVQGDGQYPNGSFYGRFVSAQANVALPFFGFDDYPNDVPSFDLGGRVIDVLGTPGHHPVSVTLYDRNTHLLLPGDIVYPGHLFVFSKGEWTDFVASIQRMVDWAATHPVKWVVGCHIETSEFPFTPFAYTTTVHPREHVLEFAPTILTEILEAALSFDGVPECTIFEEFVIHPVYKCGITWNGDTDTDTDSGRARRGR